MAAILYLDIDDEITTAAARIRGSVDPEGRARRAAGLSDRDVADELPTPRPRGARAESGPVDRGRRPGREGDRRFGRPAGLRLRRRVRGLDRAAGPQPPRPPPVEPAVTETRPGPSPAVVAGLAGAGLAAGPTGTPPSPTDGSPTAEEAIAPAGPVPPRRRRRGGSAGDDRPVAEAGTAAALVTEPIAAATGGASAVAGEGPMVEPPATEPRARSRAAALPVVPAARSGRGLSRWVVAGLIAVVALLAIAIAGYLVLPSATVVVTPSPVPVGPVDFVVRADPDATTVDAAGGVVPATRLSKEFTASGEFPVDRQAGRHHQGDRDPALDELRSDPRADDRRRDDRPHLERGRLRHRRESLPAGRHHQLRPEPHLPVARRAGDRGQGRSGGQRRRRCGEGRAWKPELRGRQGHEPGRDGRRDPRGVHPGVPEGRDRGAGQPDQGPQRPVRGLAGRPRGAAAQGRPSSPRPAS